MNRILPVLVALITMETAAAAQPFNTLFASGPVYGGILQAQVFCHLFNGGVNPITLTAPQIFEEPGTSLPLTTNNCTGTTLTSGRFCDWSVTTGILTTATHSCTILIHSLLPNAPYIRGEMDVRTVLGVPLFVFPILSGSSPIP